MTFFAPSAFFVWECEKINCSFPLLGSSHRCPKCRGTLSDLLYGARFLGWPQINGHLWQMSLISDQNRTICSVWMIPILAGVQTAYLNQVGSVRARWMHPLNQGLSRASYTVNWSEEHDFWQWCFWPTILPGMFEIAVTSDNALCLGEMVLVEASVYHALSSGVDMSDTKTFDVDLALGSDHWNQWSMWHSCGCFVFVKKAIEVSPSLSLSVPLGLGEMISVFEPQFQRKIKTRDLSFQKHAASKGEVYLPT